MTSRRCPPARGRAKPACHPAKTPPPDCYKPVSDGTVHRLILLARGFRRRGDPHRQILPHGERTSIRRNRRSLHVRLHQHARAPSSGNPAQPRESVAHRAAKIDRSRIGTPKRWRPGIRAHVIACNGYTGRGIQTLNEKVELPRFPSAQKRNALPIRRPGGKNLAAPALRRKRRQAISLERSTLAGSRRIADAHQAMIAPPNAAAANRAVTDFRRAAGTAARSPAADVVNASK